MSRTQRHSRPVGSEYWSSRLHRHGETPGRHTKTLTHKKERRQGRVEAAAPHDRLETFESLRREAAIHAFEMEDADWSRLAPFIYEDRA